MSKRNILVESKLRKAHQAYDEQRFSDADILYREVAQRAGASADIWARLAEVNRRLGRFAIAKEAGRKAVALSSNHWGAHFELGAALHCLGQIPASIPHYRKSLSLHGDQLDALFLLAKALLHQGDEKEAETLLRKSVAMRPNFVPGLTSLAGLLAQKDVLGEAKELLHQALLLWPEYAEALCHLGYIAIREGQPQEALGIYLRAIQSAPDPDQAVASYTGLLEQLGRADEALPYLEAALKKAPNHPRLNIAMGKIDLRAKRLPEAYSRLAQALAFAPSPSMQAQAHMLLGQVLDQQGQVDQAFTHLAEGNTLSYQADGIANIDSVQQAYRDKLKQIATWVTPQLVELPPPPTAAITPIFLVGFPRSGTTLLEQILDAHSELQSVEERPMVERMMGQLAQINPSGEDTLARLSDADIEALRATYFDELSKHTQYAPGKQLVDKLPLNLTAVPLIWRVFPNAKFILAIRHPFDACLSCFMQAFELNEAMSNFVSLESSITLYREVMSLWQRCTETLPLQFHRIRYEDLLVNFEHEVRSLLSFLGIGWEDAILQYRNQTKKKWINTPSYHQVTQPLYQSAMYRWQRYEKYFTSHVEAMVPYLALFDYIEGKIGILEAGCS